MRVVFTHIDGSETVADHTDAPSGYVFVTLTIKGKRWRIVPSRSAAYSDAGDLLLMKPHSDLAAFIEVLR